MDVPEALTVSSPDETHEALRVALIDVYAQLEALAARVATLEES